MKKRVLWLLGLSLAINWYIKNTLSNKSKLYAQCAINTDAPQPEVYRETIKSNNAAKNKKNRKTNKKRCKKY